MKLMDRGFQYKYLLIESPLITSQKCVTDHLLMTQIQCGEVFGPAQQLPDKL